MTATLKASAPHAVVYAVDCRNDVLDLEVNGTLQAKSGGGNFVEHEQCDLH